MRVLFVHQNFPAQFRHLAPALVARGDEVVALTFNQPPPTPGTRVVRVEAVHSTGAGHPWARDFDTKIIRGEAALRAAMQLRGEGFIPDVIVAHPGWGDSLFLKDVWPEARLGIYCEFFYGARDADHDFDPEFGVHEDHVLATARARLRNLPQTLHFDIADAALSPTKFQAGTYPEPFRPRITVCHDGIDLNVVRPGPALPLRFASGQELGADDEVITFVSRTLEPYRGFHTFVRALPELLRLRPKAHVVIVGREGKGYGAEAPQGTTWKQIFLKEVSGRIDPSRVKFLGALDYPNFLNFLRTSSLHVYLTYPFVLSWSLLEAMATECAILASDTAPVREFIVEGETGRLVSFFDHQRLAETAAAMLEQVDDRRRMGAAARAKVAAVADLHATSLPRQIAWIDALAAAQPRTTTPPV